MDVGVDCCRLTMTVKLDELCRHLAGAEEQLVHTRADDEQRRAEVVAGASDGESVPSLADLDDSVEL